LGVCFFCHIFCCGWVRAEKKTSEFRFTELDPEYGTQCVLYVDTLAVRPRNIRDSAPANAHRSANLN